MSTGQDSLLSNKVQKLITEGDGQILGSQSAAPFAGQILPRMSLFEKGMFVGSSGVEADPIGKLISIGLSSHLVMSSVQCLTEWRLT